MAGGSWSCLAFSTSSSLPQWSPGLMAGGRRAAMSSRTRSPAPQWSPGLMAGGRRMVATGDVQLTIAAMEPRPDGRGKMR